MKTKLNKTCYNYVCRSHGGGGFAFERYAVKKFDLIKDPEHISKWDAYTKDRIPVSIKFVNDKRTGDIVFSDIFNCSSTRMNFILILGVWSGDKKNLVKIYHFKIDFEFWRSLFNYKLIPYLKKIREDDAKFKKNGYSIEKRKEIWSNNYDKVYKAWEKDYNIMMPRNRSLKRIQCAITYHKFFDNIANSHFVIKEEHEVDLDLFYDSINKQGDVIILNEHMELKNGFYEIKKPYREKLTDRQKEYLSKVIYRVVDEKRFNLRDIKTYLLNNKQLGGK